MNTKGIKTNRRWTQINADKRLTANGHELTRMKTKIPPQRHRVHRTKLVREELNSLCACPTPELDSILIRVHSRLIIYLHQSASICG